MRKLYHILLVLCSAWSIINIIFSAIYFTSLHIFGIQIYEIGIQYDLYSSMFFVSFFSFVVLSILSLVLIISCAVRSRLRDLIPKFSQCFFMLILTYLVFFCHGPRPYRMGNGDVSLGCSRLLPS